MCCWRIKDLSNILILSIQTNNVIDLYETDHLSIRVHISNGVIIIKHFMTVLKGVSCVSLRPSMFPEMKLRGTLRSRKQNWLFPVGPVIKCFVIPPNSNIKKKKSFAWGWMAHKFAAVSRSTTWACASWSSNYCFPRELVSFVRPCELVSFDPRHVTRSPSIRKRIWVKIYNNFTCSMCDQQEMK